MTKFTNFLLNNAYEVDAKAQEDKLREKEPLLLHPDENIELALKEGVDGRDKSYFTSHRILVKDGKGVGKKRKNFMSIPYSSIQGFAVTTAGAFDDDTELEVWGTAGSINLNLSKKEADLFGIQRFLSEKVLGTYVVGGTPDEVESKVTGAVGSFVSWITGDASTYENDKVEQRFKTETPILLPNETVQLAFKTGRDFLVFSSLRILRIDVQGILGKRIEFETILWTSISAAVITTPSALFDRDMEMILHTNIEPKDKKDRSKLEMDFRKGRVDIYSVYKIVNNHLLGEDLEPLTDVDIGKGGWSWANLFDREASRPLNPQEMDRNLRRNPPLLQGSEQVEMAFKGIRDMIVFTTKRLIIIDPKGVTGKRIEYKSIPYKSMLAFAIETAGAVLDFDTEAMIWTDMNIIPGDDKADPPTEPEPGFSLIELEFNKKLVNIVGFKKYLSRRILGASSAEESLEAATPMLEPNESMLGSFFSYFSDNQRTIDPKDLDHKLHTSTPLLLDHETVAMAFKAGRDVTMFTNLRVMMMDVQGLTGKRVSYKSFPYSSIRAFSLRSAGSWDRDSELRLYTGNLWHLDEVEMDFRKGKVDILQIQNLLSAMVMGDVEERESCLENQGGQLMIQSSGGIGGFLNWLGGDSIEEDADQVDAQLHNETPILMSKEKVERVYKSGRDLFVYTSDRVLLIDVQGIRGKRVEYLSIPLKWIHGYEVETAGHMDRDSEIYLKNDIPKKARVQQDILVKRGDVMEVQQYLTEKLVISD